jgi:hypothetical protein
VIVGDVERKSPATPESLRPYASAAGLATFDEMVGTQLEVAFKSGSTTVYRFIAAGQT